MPLLPEGWIMGAAGSTVSDHRTRLEAVPPNWAMMLTRGPARKHRRQGWPCAWATVGTSLHGRTALVHQRFPPIEARWPRILTVIEDPRHIHAFTIEQQPLSRTHGDSRQPDFS